MQGRLLIRLSRESWIVIGLLVVIVASGVFVASSQLPWRRPVDVERERFDASRGEFAALDYVPLDNRNSIAIALENLVAEDEHLAQPDQVNGIRGFLADAIFGYYVADGPDAYKTWRRGNGADFRPPGELDAGALIQNFRRIPGAAGLDLRDPTSIEDAFDQMWRGLRVVDGGVNRAVAISRSPDGLRAVFRRVESGGVAADTVPGGLSETAWVGGSMMSGLRVFTPARSFDESLQQAGALLLCEGVIALEFAGGIQRPLWFRTFWSEERGQWVVYQVRQPNTPPNRHVMPWMF